MSLQLRRLAVLAALSGLLLTALPAGADPHDPKRSGHPLRIAAYVLHPVGYVIDLVVLRPAHWLGNHEPFATVFGHEEED